MCTSSISNVIYPKFSHGADFYTLNGQNVNVMLKFWITGLGCMILLVTKPPNTVEPPRTVSSHQQPPHYNSQFSISPKCSFTIFDLSIAVTSLQQPLFAIPWVAVVERFHCLRITKSLVMTVKIIHILMLLL